jgi:hypothetical protein
VDEESWADLVARLDRRLRRFPVGTRCADCGIGHPLLLSAAGKRVLCADCRLKRRRLPRVEEHHVGGRPSELTITIPANLHLLLTVLQGLWRSHFEPGSAEAQLFDLMMLRTIGPLFGVEV